MGTLPAELSSTSITRPIFLGLRNLTLSQVDITLMTTLLGMCSQTPLVSLKLDFCPCPTVTAMEVFFTALAASSSHSSLITLSLGIDLASDFFEAFSNPSTFAVNDHSLRILFCFPNLTTFSITSPVGFDVSTNTVVDLACAWPRLENLGLLTLLQLIPVRVTLESLYFIAKHCPHLHSLAMTFDATVIPAAPKSIPQQCMSSLGVALSPISTSGAVARILSDIFPNLQKIHTDFDDDEEDDGTEHRRWKEVESLLPEFVATREEERMRARG
ncbi:hypothetical protein C8R44DRAFT_787561 [Mycena epipterygia]|nr:hypothetical protein C8R44DRAFT_787561 [Mycena epipterygia]